MNKIEKAVLEIFYWQYSNTNSFMNLLVTLIQKADYDNRQKLRRAFPELVFAWELWQDTPNQDAFFEEWIPEVMQKRREKLKDLPNEFS